MKKFDVVRSFHNKPGNTDDQGTLLHAVTAPWARLTGN